VPDNAYGDSASFEPHNNIMRKGDMEGSESLIYSSPSSLFYGRGKNCKMSMVDAYEHPSRVKGGQKSLQIMGQTKQKAYNCWIKRDLGPSCNGRMLHNAVNKGDILVIEAQVMTEMTGKIFQMYTGHYHTAKLSDTCTNINAPSCPWYQAPNDANMVSRVALTPYEWKFVRAVHKVGGPEWFDYAGLELEPEKCNHYQLRFRVTGGATWWIDNVRVKKITPGSNVEVPMYTTPKSGFLHNPIFEYGFQHWKVGNINEAPVLEKDPILNRDVMVITGPAIRDKRLIQNIDHQEIQGGLYKYKFWLRVDLAGRTRPVQFHVGVRMGIRDDQGVLQIYNQYPFNLAIDSSPDWQEFETNTFSMFEELGDYRALGDVEYIHFQMWSTTMVADGEWRVAGFESVTPDLEPTTFTQ